MIARACVVVAVIVVEVSSAAMTDHEVNFAARCLLAMASGGHLFEFEAATTSATNSHADPTSPPPPSSSPDAGGGHGHGHQPPAAQFESASLERDSHFMIARILTDLTRLRQDPVKLDPHPADQTAAGVVKIRRGAASARPGQRLLDESAVKHGRQTHPLP